MLYYFDDLDIELILKSLKMTYRELNESENEVDREMARFYFHIYLGIMNGVYECE